MNARVEPATGTCPKCSGTCRIPVSEDQKQWKTMYSGYDPATDTLQCNNCGGQYMFGRPTGKVYLNREGFPCTHEYTGVQAGRCYWKYTCKHCGDNHSIDSGD